MTQNSTVTLEFPVLYTDATLLGLESHFTIRTPDSTDFSGDFLVLACQTERTTQKLARAILRTNPKAAIKVYPPIDKEMLVYLASQEKFTEELLLRSRDYDSWDRSLDKIELDNDSLLELAEDIVIDKIQGRIKSTEMKKLLLRLKNRAMARPFDADALLGSLILDLEAQYKSSGSKSGQESKLFQKYIAVKEAFSGRIKLNELNQNIELDGKPLDFNTITLLLAEVTGEDFNQQQAESCVLRCAKENSYCPVRDYLNQVHEQYKGDFISLDTLSSELLGTEKEIENIYLKKALIAAVARIFNPGCKVDTAYILQGNQGIRKSSFIKALASEEWFSDTLNEGKDQLLHLHRYWIHEWSELENVTGKREISKVKALLSSPKDSFRPPYGRNIVEYPRKSVIWASTNKTEFLSDPTGERRYWVAQLPKKRIDIKRVEEMRDAIWASAVEAYLKGEIHWLTPEEQKVSDELNKNFKETDLWQDAIEKYLASRDFVRIPEILEEVCGVEVAHMCKLHDKRVADILKQLGWDKKVVKLAGRTARGWVPKKTELVTELVTSQNPENTTVSADDNSPVTSYQLILKTFEKKNESANFNNACSTDLTGNWTTHSQDVDSASDSAVTSSRLPGNPEIKIGQWGRIQDMGRDTNKLVSVVEPVDKNGNMLVSEDGSPEFKTPGVPFFGTLRFSDFAALTQNECLALGLRWVGTKQER